MTQLTFESLAQRVESLERKVAELSRHDEPPDTLGDEQSNDPEAIARWLDAFDAIPPLNMTTSEETAWQAARALS